MNWLLRKEWDAKCAPALAASQGLREAGAERGLGGKGKENVGLQGDGESHLHGQTPPPAKVLYLPSPGLHYKEHHEGTFPTPDWGDPDGTLLSLAAQCLVRKTGAARLLISFRGMRIH